MSEGKKSLIEKIWWAIPPAFILVVYFPLFRGIKSTNKWIQDLISMLVGDSIVFGFFMFGFMALGFLITKKQSLKFRVLLPILLSIFGSIVAILVATATS